MREFGLDNYPEDLAPEFDEFGGVATPFATWWERVRRFFPTVPEEVAQEWLHRHWRHSPFSFLRSAEHRFRLVTRKTSELSTIRWNWNDFADDHSAAIEQGRYLVEDHGKKWPGWLFEYMVANGDFPTPPILVDNYDRHVLDGLGPEFYPSAVLLVEGHRRFAMAPYLVSIGRFVPEAKFWMMTKIQTDT